MSSYQYDIGSTTGKIASARGATPETDNEWQTACMDAMLNSDVASLKISL
jgi:hypothetical protein